MQKKEIKRVFLVVLDSVGIGALPDAGDYGDEGSHTLRACFRSGRLRLPRLREMGLFNIDDIACGEAVSKPAASFGRLAAASPGKDTTTGHWEIAGIVLDAPFPTYPEGFPEDLLRVFSEKTGRGVLCNRPFSGTEVIAEYGREHMETGALIVYTSADSVFQVAAHEDVVPIPELYRCCGIARELLVGEHGVGRVIARPFAGTYPDYERTSRRHDFSLLPVKPTVLDALEAAGLATIGVGKISDIFADKGISVSYPEKGNPDCIQKMLEIMESDFRGLCFVNLVDFDMLYGHRNHIEGYTEALNDFDRELAGICGRLRSGDVLMITADHGCDPSTNSTDHSREFVPWLVYGEGIRAGVNLGTRETFADIGMTIAELLGVPAAIAGTSSAELIRL